MMENEDLHISVARLEERLKASDMALKLSADSLDSWKSNSAAWLQIVKDQQSKFVTRSDVIATVTVAVLILGLILKYAK